MNTVPSQGPRDPRNPGAPILPRDRWSLPPHHRWTFSHMREMTATAGVRRGPGPVRTLLADPQDITGIGFESHGDRRTVGAWLAEDQTDGFLVLHGGRIRHESYHDGMRAQDLHLSMSMAKSILGITTGILADSGRIHLSAPLTQYLPALEATAYRGATVQHLLDMTSGVVFDESYDVAGSHMQKLGQAVGWGEGPRIEGWPETIWQLILELTEAERSHGAQFLYRSIETDLLGFVVESATGQPLAELVSDLIWQRIGAEEDAAYTLDHGGFALADGGFNATLRDYARFAQMILDGGMANGQRVVPAGWIEEARFGTGGDLSGVQAEILPDGGYHNKWWQADRARGVIMAQGIYGQCIYLDFDAGFAAVKLSTWPTALSVPGVKTRLAAFRAIGQELAGA